MRVVIPGEGEAKQRKEELGRKLWRLEKLEKEEQKMLLFLV